MNNMLMLIRREIWEHRSLWIAPLVVAGVILVIAAFGGIHVGDGDDLRSARDPIAAARSRSRIARTSAVPCVGAARQEQTIYAITLSTFTAIRLFSMAIVVFFYLIDSLLTERKDRSILFWKSLPVSGHRGGALEAADRRRGPAGFVLIVSSVMQVLFAGVWSLRFSGTLLGDGSWPGMADLVASSGLVLVLVPSGILWYLPLLAYLMVVSVWARRERFLWAVLPPAVDPGDRRHVPCSRSTSGVPRPALRRLVRNHGTGRARSHRRTGGRLRDGSRSVRRLTAVFTHVETWAGVLAAAAMIFAAIRIRRYRDDS